MSDFKTIGQVAAYRPLPQCGMEELAARQVTIKPSGGVLFARNVDGQEKTAARQHVLDLFHPQVWSGRLHMLTMPGVHWRFERKLLATRETGWMSRGRSPSRTHFTGLENDRALYAAAAGQMPGLQTLDPEVKAIRPFPFAESGVKTRYAALFFANVDDLMAHDDFNNPWHAAWLDFTGPLTIERLKLIERFYHRFVSDVLIVTALKARWNERTSAAIERAGGHSRWLRQHLRGYVLHDLEYHDTSPMAQFAVCHRLPTAGLWFWRD
jgi:hypothetical protein